MMIDQFYPVVGGAEQQALRISMKLTRKGHKVTVLTRQGKDGLAGSEEYRGITIHRLPVTGVSGTSKLKSTLPATRWLIKNRDNYDIVHCHGVNPLEWSAMLAGMVTGKPYVVKIPLSNFMNYAGAKDGFKMQAEKDSFFSARILRPLFLPVLKFVRKRLIRKARRIFAISPEISATLNKSGFKNIASIPNGIDTDEFTPAAPEQKTSLRQSLNLPEKSVIFVYAGRLAVEKNLKTLLLAWMNLSQDTGLPKSELLILGSGTGQYYSTEQELRQFTAENNLNNVTFTGSVPNVSDYLRAADAFILPSYWEGMSNSILEAMACGIPTIASDIAGNRALIENEKSGLLFDPYSPHQLTECIRLLAKNPEIRDKLGSSARQIAEQKYSLQKITADIDREYQNILAPTHKV